MRICGCILEKGCVRYYSLISYVWRYNHVEYSSAECETIFTYGEKKSSMTEFHCGLTEFKNFMFPGNTIEQTKKKIAQNSLTLRWKF